MSDAECTQPGFQTCNVDAEICGECTFNRDCTGADKKVCDDKTARCVGCLTSRDCLGADRQPNGRYCDTTDNSCKQGCLTDAECGANTRCKRDSGEELGRCIECEPAAGNPDQGCIDEARPRCEPQSLLCVECLGDSDCATAQCLTSRHACVECVRNEVCLKGSICNTATNGCIEGCSGGVGDANCPAATPVCDPVRGSGHGACVECLRDADCPRTKVCDTTKAMCVTGCHGDSTRCIDTSGAVPAPIDQVCEPSLDRCVQCRDQADCPSDKFCDATTFACRFKKTGEPCTTNGECGYNPADPNPSNRSALGAACISTIICDSPKSSPGLGGVSVCSQSAAALPGRGEQGSCPSGFVADKTNAVNATGISSVYGVRCVSTSKQCR